MNTLEKWYSVIKSNDLNDLEDLLADDVVFYSPVVYTPQKGKEITKVYLIAAKKVFGEIKTRDMKSVNKNEGPTFRYIKEIVDGNSALLEFETEVDGIYINGVDLISWDERGKITEFKVIVRPLQAVTALHRIMQAVLKEMK